MAEWEDEWISRHAGDSRSDDELIDALKSDIDDDQYNEILTILQSRRNPNLIGQAVRMCKSADPADRAVGAGILGQNGAGSQRILLEECVDALVDRVLHDDNADVLQAASIALDDYEDPRIAPSLAQLRHHDSEGVRYGVVMGLLGREDQSAVEALITLSADADVDVRNWATFGLARQIDLDTPEIREALLQRLNDEDDETRGEALIGLARRDDERVVEPLIRELRLIAERQEDYWDLAFEAAMEIGDPRLYNRLTALEEECGDNPLLTKAIVACRISEPK